MTKQGTRVEVNTFVRGLITEASPLNYPANASIDEVNFELKRDGTRQRRLGMGFEDGYVFHSASPLNGIGYQTKTTSTYIWEGAGGVLDVTFLVFQVGNQLKIHNLVDARTPVSGAGFKVSLTLDFAAEAEYSFTTINGKLVIASGNTHVAIVDYEGGTLFNLEYIPLKVRDVWGIEEPKELEEDPQYRPKGGAGPPPPPPPQNSYTDPDGDEDADGVPNYADPTPFGEPETPPWEVPGNEINPVHEYNLMNQGWGIPRKNKAGELVNPINEYFGELYCYPSNSETVWTGLQFQAVEGAADPYERMFNNLYVDRFGLDIGSGKGYFILDLHNRGNARKGEVDKNKNKYPVMPLGKSYPGDYMTTGASVVATYSGRVFYTGFTSEVKDGDKRSPVLNDYVFFSRLVKSDSDINKCYQESDPTSRDSSDVLETDGGFLRISGAKNILRLATLGQRLVVIASNGVWSVSGGSDYGFSASNFRVDKITSFGCIAPNSVVEVNGSLLYWGAESIFKIGSDQMGTLVVEDFSAASINSYYDAISLRIKKACVGVFDSVEKKVRWILHMNRFINIGFASTELIFDTLIGCYYQHKIEGYEEIGINSIFFTPETGVGYIALRRDALNIVKYTFATYKDTTFRDWKDIDGVGVDAKAFLLTGALTAGDSGIDKQAPYITLHFRKAEPSSCLMRSQWEWSNDPGSHKFSSLVETYRSRTGEGFDTVISKSKLRGKGKAISLYFETSPYKDCQLLGWNLTINGNAVT